MEELSTPLIPKKRKDRSFWIERAKQRNKSIGAIKGSKFVEPGCNCIPWLVCSLCKGIQ